MRRLILVLVAVSGWAADADFFEMKIRPVLAKNCYACHSGQVKQPLGGIRLDTREGFAAVKDKVWGSVSYSGKMKMPPAGQLDEETLRDLKTWLDAGAEYPATVVSGKREKFWAFEKLSVAKAPEMKRPVGANVLDKASLLRRVTFDLTGLPPTPKELREFLGDASAGAYAKVVERLLASPHYGERWARHWLDLVRYAETNGHEYDNDKLAPWRYRDYVIRAFNEDLPYNQFVKEHVAGDLLPRQRLSKDGTRVESPLATGFYFFGEVLNSSTDPVKSRADEVDNQIDVMGKAFTGLTVACARCHDHKFDPIPTAEYYGMAGILHSTEYREVVLDSPARKAAIAKLRRPWGLVPVQSEVKYREGDTVVAGFNGQKFRGESVLTKGAWRAEGAAFGEKPIDGAASSLTAGAAEFVGTLTSPEFRMNDQKFLHVRMSGTPVEKKMGENTPVRFTVVCGGYKARHIFPEGLEPKWMTIELVLERKRACYFEIVDHSRTGYLTVDEVIISDHNTAPETVGGLARLGPVESLNVPPSEFGVSAAEGEGHDVAVHVRGNHQQLGAMAPRKFLTVLAGEGQKPIAQGSGRLELAERMASEANPLTARVIVNRLWKHHFGEGLVKTVDNFGLMGERPKDQAMLDGLAAEFVASGWSVKAMQRKMVLSELYQSTALRPRRLEAEAVRDAILSVSGKLNETLYGPSVVPYISAYQNGRGRPASGPLDGNGRRSIYVQVRRNFIQPLFTAFDYPPPASTTGVRGTSAVPAQALLLLNNEFVHAQAKEFARSVMAESAEERGRIESMYLRAFARRPEERERARIAEYLAAQKDRTEEERWMDVAHVIFNSPEFVYVR